MLSGRKVIADNGPAVRSERKFLFRGDDYYRDGPVGRTLGDEAEAADIQNFADHVLRKETSRTSRFVSFTEELKVARRFSVSGDHRNVRKVEMERLRELEAQGTIRVWDPDQVYEALKQATKKLAKQAADVRTAMKRNGEILIEGQIPAGILEQTN